MFGFPVFVLTVLTAAYVVFGFAASLPFLILPITAAFFFSALTPLTIIAIRHQVRLTRVKLINVFARNFGFDPSLHPLPSEGPAPPQADISFEFVKGKYYADLDIDEGEEPRLSDMPRFPMMLHADWMLLFCALPFMIFSGFGIFVLFAPVSEILFPESSISKWLWPSVLALGGVDTKIIYDMDSASRMHVNVLTIVALAFAGAYFFTLRLLLRAVAVFDLSPITFLRCFTHMVLAVTLAVVIYRVFPSMQDVLSGGRWVMGRVGVETPEIPPLRYADPQAGLNPLWLLLAFAFGFLPDSALQYALERSRLIFKDRYRKAEEHTLTVPVTLIDGIDPVVAYRLEEANIHDVQNLATFNAIMLHVESPFGIYETVDWVAQAQLCNVAGPDRFLLLKSLNIRTVFDLERSVLAPDADPWIVAEVGRVLFADGHRDQAMRAGFGFGAAPEDRSARVTPEAVKHIARVMLDDLHVHRLRQTWLRIAGRLGAETPAGVTPGAGLQA